MVRLKDRNRKGWRSKPFEESRVHSVLAPVSQQDLPGAAMWSLLFCSREPPAGTLYTKARTHSAGTGGHLLF